MERVNTTGNLERKDGQAYDYLANGHIHAVTSAGTKGSFDYGANGNMTTRAISETTYTLSYDQANRLVGYNGGGISATFVYDGDGVRVKGEVGGIPPGICRGPGDMACETRME